MKNILIAGLFLFSTLAQGAGRLQNEDFKTLAEITAKGGTAANLLNDTKIYVTANGINNDLNTAITNELIGGGGSSGINVLANAGFEAGGLGSGWSSAGAATTVNSGPNLLYKTTSVIVTPGGAAEGIESYVVNTPTILNGASCKAEIYYKGPASNFELSVYDASNNSLSDGVVLTLKDVTEPQRAVLYFKCPGLGTTMKMRVHSTGAGAVVAFDNAYLGSSDYQLTKEASLYGRIVTPATAGCDWPNTDLAFSVPPQDLTCPVPTTYGEALAPTTRIPAIRFTNLPAGKYRVVATGKFAPSTSLSNQNFYGRFTDGTNTTSIMSLAESSLTSYSSPGAILEGVFEYQAGQANVTISLENRGTVFASTLDIQTVLTDFEIAVYKYPTDFETTINAKCSSLVDCSNTFTATISDTGVVTGEGGTAPDWINGNCSVSGGGLESKTCTVFANVFKTSSPNCTVSANAGGVVFAHLSALTQTSFTVDTVTNAGGVAAAATISCTKAGSDFNSEKDIVGNFKDTVKSTDGLRIEKFRFAGGTATTVCSSSPCTLYRATAGVSTVTRSAAGVYQSVFNAQVFTETPACTFTGSDNVGFVVPTVLSGGTATTLNFATGNLSGSTIDTYFDVMCVGK